MTINIKPTDNFVWYDVQNLSDDDRIFLEKNLSIKKMMLAYAIDPNEQARFQADPLGRFNMIIFSTVTNINNSQIQPVTFIYDTDNQYLISITNHQTQFLTNEMISILADGTPPTEPIGLIMSTMSQQTEAIFDTIETLKNHIARLQEHLTKQGRGRRRIETMLRVKIRTANVANAIHNNNTLIKSLKVFNKQHWQHHLHQQLDTLDIELNQAASMIDIAQTMIDATSDAYSNISDYRLNSIMKWLTVWSILLTIPTIVSGFYGQNVTLPLAHGTFSWVGTLLITLLLIIITTIALWLAGYLKND